jgi:hypothetical protein
LCYGGGSYHVKEVAMDDLIEALTIFRKYGNPRNPTHCEHDELWVVGIGPVNDADAARLDRLGFFWDGEGWKSFRFGSA